MVTLGIDAHKRSHTIVATDQAGRQLGLLTVGSNLSGLDRMIRWARTDYGTDLRWAVEDCRHVTSRLERVLLDAGQTITRVPPHLTARHRRTGRTRGKSDPVDALAIARAALQNPDLPTATLNDTLHDLRQLLTHRSQLVAERTRTINRLRWHLHQLDPDQPIARRSLRTPSNLQRITTRLAELPTTITATIATEQVTTISTLTSRITDLEHHITTQVTALPAAEPLLAIPGCGVLTAAKILTETADITRFATADKYAAYTGTAPIPASSGNTTHHRLNRAGNRQLNAAIHTIATTQIRLNGPGRDYYQRQRANGKTTKDALRCLKRKIANTLYRLQRQTALT
jgi:transposase